MSDDDRPLGPPPVDPLSDVTWARVERGLWKRLDADVAPEAPRARWRRGWIAAPVLAAAAAVVIVLITTGDPSEERAAPEVVTAPAPAIEPSRVVAGAAPSSVSYGDAHIELAARTAIVMDREGSAPSVLLEHGTATFAVAPRQGRPAFIVRAGDTVVRVVGTRFEVARDGEEVAVAVEHGIVDVQHRGQIARVSAGRRWSSTRPEVVATAPVAEAPRDPVETTETAGTTETTKGSATPVVDHAPPPSRIPSRPPSRTRPVDPERATYEHLVTLEARDPTAAMTGYLELAKGNTRWSAVALYAAARLAADRDDPRAATFLTIYLRRFPAGANAPDARNLLDRIQGASK